MREALRILLIGAACSGRTLTYAEVAQSLGIPPKHTIHKAALLIEDLMRHQAAAGEPQLASFVVSKARRDLPARGFFMLARDLRLHEGADEGPEARSFVEAERERCRAHF